MDHRTSVVLILALSAWGCATTTLDSAPPPPPPGPQATNPCAAHTLPLQCGPLEEGVRATTIAEDTGVRTCEAFCTDSEQRSGRYRAVLLESPPRVTLGGYKFGRRDGLWTTRLHDDRGPIVESTHWLQGSRHGPYASYYADGRAHRSGAFDRERRHGKWLVRAPDGVVLSEENWVRGTKVGTQVTRHESGQTATEQNFDESGKPHGRWCSWRPDGTEIECTEFLDGTGVGREYDETGSLRREVHYEAGQLHGTETRFDEDRRVETPWDHGVQTGVRRELIGECVAEKKTIEAGKAQGPYQRRNCETDTVVRTGRFCDGHFCGLWIHRNEQGGVERVVEYDDLSMKLAEARFADDKLVDFWTLDEQLRLQRAACYQALAGGLCCDIGAQEYRVSTECLSDAAPTPETTEL